MKGISLTVAAVILVAGCVPGQPDGRAVYGEFCAVCHGPDGRGDGPLAQEMLPAPADLTQLTAENDGVFPRSRIARHVDGYARANDGTMPDFGAAMVPEGAILESNPGVISPVPPKLAAVLDYLERIQIQGE